MKNFYFLNRKLLILGRKYKMATHILFGEGKELKIAIFHIYASIWFRIYVMFQACAAFLLYNL